MNATEFLNKNKSISCASLSKLLKVSSGTITKMKKEVTVIQSLALDALEDLEKINNRILIDMSNYTDNFGRTYFSCYVVFKSRTYFVDVYLGSGSHAESIVIERLKNIGVLNKNLSFHDLYELLNITIHTSSREVKKQDMYNGSERDCIVLKIIRSQVKIIKDNAKLLNKKGE